jgi:hypothetical protein
MVHDIGSFQVIFRIVLLLLIFLPVMFLYYVPHTRRYNNTDHKWMCGYVTGAVINMMAYLVVNTYDTFLSCSLYVATSVACSLYFTYQELFVRLIHKPTQQPNPNVIESQVSEPKSTAEPICPTQDSNLFERLEYYMNSMRRWQDPDLSLQKVVSDIYTNHTSLLKVIKQHGFNSYSDYVNRKRVDEFIQIIRSNGGYNYQQTFFDVEYYRNDTVRIFSKKGKERVTPSYVPKYQFYKK